jgi:glycosyltransferase involved in cell wall biosynthesis
MTVATVAHIITKLELGGAQQNTLFTVKHLDRARFRPVLITGEEGYLVPEALKLEGVEIILVPELVREIDLRRDLGVVHRLRRILRGIKAGDGQPLIVHTHSSKAGIVGRWAARLAGADVIIHSIHGFGFHDEQHPLVRRVFIGLEKMTGHITHSFIGVSHANIRTGAELRIFPQDKATLIRSGIDLTQFGGASNRVAGKKKELGIDPSLPLITMIGCLKPQKAPVDFVTVAGKVLQERAATFALVGDGELRSQVEARVLSLGIGDRFRIFGWRNDVPDILAATDIFVLTSLWEGLPRAVPEAMAMGIPVVATRVDGTPEAVRDGINGYLLEVHDTAGIAKHVLYLLNNPEKAREMGLHGRNMVEEFDIRTMVHEQERLYERLLAKRGT